MKKVTAESGTLAVNSGQVQLTAEQAKPRLHALQLVGKTDGKGGGTYNVTGPIQFKRGETFGFDGEVAKNGVLRDPDAEQMAKLEIEEAIEKKVTARLQANFNDAVAAAVTAKLAQLKPETAALVTAELKAAAEAAAGTQ